MTADPFDRALDRVLTAIRVLCREYEIPDAYRLVPGEGDDPDAWRARCPLHPSSGHHLLVVSRGEDAEPWLACRVGCSPAIVRFALDLDPEFNEAAEVAARVLIWAQEFTRRRQQGRVERLRTAA
jgi:hypothetical protein